MLWGGTVIRCYSNCPTACGCGGTTSVDGNWPTINLVSDSMFEELPKLELPVWLKEQRKTPCRMKRSFPANKPGSIKAHRRACY